MSHVDYGILGSLEATRAGTRLLLGGAKQRTVLALLLINANRVVTTDEMIEALWPGRAPGKPLTAIQGYVSELRRVLDADRPFEVVVTEPAGYRMPVDPDALDLFRLEALLRKGRDGLQSGVPDEAARAFTSAIALFRGPPLADFTYESWAQAEIGRLVELRLVCVEERIEADLRLGRHAEVVGELEALVAEHPLREGLRGHLILALYQSGRQSEALAAYQDARTALVEEFGIEPTRALQDLERRILLQDPTLDLEPSTRQPVSLGGERTLVFTDIEGSTRLVHRFGDDYAHLLVEHRRMVRHAVESHEGRVVANYGDCFFAIFDDAVDALGAAAESQRALAAYPWPGEVPLRIRIGVHTGRPVAVGDGFVGLDVHRGSRICDAAHGGQVLLSSAAASAVEGQVPTRDLGEHRLRDMSEPDHIFQLVAPGLIEEFPPLRTQQLERPASADRSIMVAASGPLPSGLVDLAASLAASHARHTLIAARLVELGEKSPKDLAAELTLATADLEAVRDELAATHIDARVATFTSASSGEDIVRLAAEQSVDLVLLERSPPDFAEGALDLKLRAVLADAPCDVAIHVAHADHSGSETVLVPFGGGTHDWAALELGAWLAAVRSWRLRLLGVAGDQQVGRRDASRLLAAASLAVQQLVGVTTEPALVAAGPDSLVEASSDVGLVVVGLPDDWNELGLGQARLALTTRGASTTLFARRGIRPGGLAPREGQTRFTWSLASVGSGS